MRPEQDPTVKLAATLHLVDKAPVNCLISQVSESGLCIKPDSSDGEAVNFKHLRKGDGAELHIDNPVAPDDARLLVHATVDKSSSQLVILTFNNPVNPAVRQLQNWFNPDKAHRQSPSTPLDLQLEEITRHKLQELLDSYLLELESQLVAMCDTASNEQQHSLMDALDLIRSNSDSIKKSTCDSILKKNQKFQHNTTQHDDQRHKPYTEMDEEDIALIDVDEFEDWLSMETIIRRATSKHQTAINCLEKRYGELLHRELGRDELPISIGNICNSLKSTFKQYNINPELMPLLYRVFDETVIHQIAGLYDGLNSTLKTHGILPDIETNILAQIGKTPQRQSPQGIPSLPVGSQAAPGEGLQAGTGSHNHPAIPSGFNLADTQQALYSAVQSILGLSRPEGNVQAVTDASQAVDPTELIRQLSSIQHNQSTVTSIANGSSISDVITEQTGKKISIEVSDIINLVSSLFTKISSYKQISDPIIKQLKRLEVPIAKTALLENDFFSSSEHPARQLINQMTDLSLNSEMPNQALEKKFETIIGNIIENYDEDSSVYQQALQSIASLSKQQSTVYTRNTARIAQTYEGRQKVTAARKIVRKEISLRLKPPQEPEVLVHFVKNGWRELLQLTYIKEGSDSSAWQQQLENLDQLIIWINKSDRDETGAIIQHDVNREMETDTFIALIEQQLNAALPGDYRHQNTIKTISDCLKGKIPIVMIDVSAEEIDDDNEDFQNPELNRWIQRARTFKVGDELSYIDDESDQRNIKLAWIGDDHQHFVFVNNRGQKVFDYKLIELANELSQGLYLTDEESEWPLVEKSLYSTVQQAYEQLAYKSSHDELTGLFNRKECDRILAKAITQAQHGNSTHYLIYCDIDKFSLANDLYGHVAGDQLLTEISKLIVAATPEETVIARMAGNEFVILLEDTDSESCHKTAENIRHSISDHDFEWQEHIFQLTASVGISSINEYTSNVVDLLRNVITASKSAKESGGNRICDVDQNATDISHRQVLLSWIDKLNDGLHSDHLALRAQKIVACDPDNTNSHYEILLGIKNEDGSLGPPMEFIETAEHYNRMQRVDRWVIENSFAWLQKQLKANKPLPHLSINLSANSINDEQLADFLIEKFRVYQIPSNHICFEITETATIANIATAADFIREIKKIGCKFSLDDFGSGNASYQYLKNLPVDFIKIDGEFVKDIHNNKNDYALVKSIKEIANLMGKWTIAEYAENDEIIAILKEIGVDYLQGYGIHMPTPLEEINLD